MKVDTLRSIRMHTPQSRASVPSRARRRALGLIVWPYVLIALGGTFAWSLGWGGYREVAQAFFYVSTLVCCILLSVHLLLFGWMSRSDPQFVALCQEISPPPLSHSQYQDIKKAAHHPEIAVKLKGLHRSGLPWDNDLAEHCRRLNKAH